MPTLTPLPPLEQIADAIGLPLDEWHGNCHTVSLAMLREGIVQGRVARGTARGVGSQHSWIALCDPSLSPLTPAVYDPAVPILDPTLWCYREDVEGLWHGTLADDIHFPHGGRRVWDTGCPMPGVGEPIVFDGLPSSAAAFVRFLDNQNGGRPLDLEGWSRLVHGGLRGIPELSALVEAAADHPDLRARIPIDIIGMHTSRNPGGLYLHNDL